MDSPRPAPHRPGTSTSRAIRASASALIALGLVLTLTITLPSKAAAETEGETTAWVDTGGDCLRLREEPGLDGGDISCLEHGDEVTLLGPEEEQDGFVWAEAEVGDEVGWLAKFYLTTDPGDVQILYEAPAPTGVIQPPPIGGLTAGAAGVTDVASLVAAQPYEVASVWRFDVATQRMEQYTPGAPAFTNSLTTIAPDDVVMIRRTGVLTSAGTVPEAPLTVAGTPNVLKTPPIGGMTIGLSGTTDPNFLVMQQEFTAESVWYFHVDSQTWLSYTAGAPDYVQSLKQGHLRTDSVVWVKRGPDAPKPPSSEDSTYFETSLTYFYCVPGDNERSHGDGGGYCGAMANGEVVHEGAAACKPSLLGQRFTIDGDPTERVYECTDTGGSVLRDHRDIWFMNSDDGYEWWGEVGDRAFITILDADTDEEEPEE